MVMIASARVKFYNILLMGSEKMSVEMNKRLSLILDNLSLFSVMVLVSYRFIEDSTMFEFYFLRYFRPYMIAMLVIFGGSRYIGRKIQKIYGPGATGTLTSVFKECLLAVGLLSFVYFVAWNTQTKTLFYIPLATICLVDMIPEKVFKWYLIVVTTLCLATVVCCVSGCIQNIAEWSGSEYRSALGFVNTTDAASYFTFISLYFWCIKKDEGAIKDTLFSFIVLVISYFTCCITNSRTVLICGALTFLAIIWDKIENKHINTSKWVNTIRNLYPYVFPAIGVALFAVFFLYYANSDVGNAINRLLTRRIEISVEQIKNIGIHPFGSFIEHSHGYGATALGHSWSVFGYGYIDIAYVALLIRYGFLMTIVFIVFWMRTVFSCVKNGRGKIAIAMAIMAFHAISESRILDINYNIIIGMFFCSFGCKKNPIVKSESEKRAHIFQIAFLMAIGLLIILRKEIISFFRLVFSLFDFSDGNRAFGAFLLIIFVGWFLLCFLQVLCNRYIAKDGKIRAFILLAAFICLVILFRDFVLYKGEKINAAQIECEEDIIEYILANTSQPIYACELGEIYCNEYDDISKLAASTEWISRGQKGSIIVAKDVELFNVFKRGAFYSEISDYSGIYSFDIDVVDALRRKGYRVERYYYSQRACRLDDLAVQNALKQNELGYIVINGEKTVDHNRKLDQFKGEYEVEYTIMLDPKNQNNDLICELTVVGEDGERVIKESKLSYSDFYNNECIKTIDYSIDDTPMMQYLVRTNKGSGILLKRIEWRRIS